MLFAVLNPRLGWSIPRKQGSKSRNTNVEKHIDIEEICAEENTPTEIFEMEIEVTDAILIQSTVHPKIGFL